VRPLMVSTSDIVLRLCFTVCRNVLYFARMEQECMDEGLYRSSDKRRVHVYQDELEITCAGAMQYVRHGASYRCGTIM